MNFSNTIPELKCGAYTRIQHRRKGTMIEMRERKIRFKIIIMLNGKVYIILEFIYGLSEKKRNATEKRYLVLLVKTYFILGRLSEDELSMPLFEF
jgi:hypothetical protein